jgi:hypothetical protein
MVHTHDRGMINLFQLLKKQEKQLTEGFENKRWWETQDNNTFERNVIGPDGNYYDQEALYESIKESDKKRLIKFG